MKYRRETRIKPVKTLFAGLGRPKNFCWFDFWEINVQQIERRKH